MCLKHRSGLLWHSQCHFSSPLPSRSSGFFSLPLLFHCPPGRGSRHVTFSATHFPLSFHSSLSLPYFIFAAMRYHLPLTPTSERIIKLLSIVLQHYVPAFSALAGWNSKSLSRSLLRACSVWLPALLSHFLANTRLYQLVYLLVHKLHSYSY